MAQITFEEAQKIVENAMRTAGYGGNIENAWKDSVDIPNGSVPLTLNLKSLRDAIAQSIVDILTHTESTNTISIGNTSGTEGIDRIDSNVNLNDGSEGAARKGDSVETNLITDADFITWIFLVSTAINTLAPGSIINIPTTATGKITTSSNSVKIGD